MILGVKCYFEDDATVLGFPNIRAWVIRFVSSKTPTGSMSQKSIESLRCWDETPSDFEITSIIDNFFLKLIVIYESIINYSRLILATNLISTFPKISFAAYRARKFLTGIKWLGVVSTRPRQSQARSRSWDSWSQRHGWNQELTVDDPNKRLCEVVVIGQVLIECKKGGEEKTCAQMVHVILCTMDPNCNLERISLRYQIWNSAARQVVLGCSIFSHSKQVGAWCRWQTCKCQETAKMDGLSVAIRIILDAFVPKPHQHISS